MAWVSGVVGILGAGVDVTLLESCEPLPNLCFGQSLSSIHLPQTSPDLYCTFASLLQVFDGRPLLQMTCQRRESHEKQTKKQQQKHGESPITTNRQNFGRFDRRFA